MKEDVSDKNIEKLLKESYRPAEPSAEFEGRLFGAMLREMQALPMQARPPLHRWLREIFALQADRPRWWAAVVAADLAIILLSFAVFFQMVFRIAPEVTPSRQEFALAQPKVEIAPVETSIPMPDFDVEPKPAREPVEEMAAELARRAAREREFEFRPASFVQISEWVAPAHLPEFDPSGARIAEPLERAPYRRPFDIGSVVGTVADEVKKELAARREVILVLMLDESSNLERDRRLIAKEVAKEIRELANRMSAKQATRLQLALVSFGQTPTLHLGPTDNPAALSEAIPRVKSDPSGKENVIHAIRFALDKIKAPDRRKFLLVLSDEEGSDTGDDALVDAALAELKKSDARLYIFGKEALFQQRLVREWLRDERGERIGPSEWVPRGIETARQEFFTPDWLFSPYTGRNIPAGFGSFVLSMLARQSGGAYYILRDAPSEYDDALLAKYEPEWVTRKEYDARVNKNQLRRSIRNVIDEWSKARPSHTLGGLTEIGRIEEAAKEEIAKAEQSLNLVERGIAELESTPRKLWKKETERWQANYDLTLAQLYKFRFLLREYALLLKNCLRDGFPKPGARQKFNLYHVTCDLRAAAQGGRGEKDRKRAEAALDYVAEHYKGTPWGKAAEDEKKYLSPLSIKPGYHVQSAKPKTRM
ncbi:MAG: vWA domain-containing protein [Planctomycetota bacterium]